MARLLNDGSTKSAVEHRFRPIKRDAAEMLAAIAREFGDGVTGKAVSGYFERVKKEPHWDRTKSIADIITEGTPKTPTPARKRAAKGKKAAARDDGDDEEPQEFDTPSKKKTPLNKVKGSRVSKASRAKQQPLSYAGQDLEDDEEELEDEQMVKMENIPVSSNGGNGHEYGYAVTGDDQENYYDAGEDYGEAYANA
ncbi:hypothetical protein LAWI1_G001157 [Lachnellula willkommii]|uniref:Uncharacterized protein n=1 Tax=Lachnellula willkommii TaxID=215461 RepID=A0A559MCE0_9HELO|nr:hypothetical protein LAWI1_G001157 [Lachnellula willkommii]